MRLPPFSDQIQIVGRDLSTHISQVGAKAARNASTAPRLQAPQQPPPGIAEALFGSSLLKSFTTLLDEEEDGYDDPSDDDRSAALPPRASPQIRKKQQEEASDGWDGPGSWDEVGPGDPSLHDHNQKSRWGVEIRKPRHNYQSDDDQDSVPPDIRHRANTLDNLRAKYDLPPPTNGRPKEKKKKKSKSSNLDV